jgi:hypothetical protein
MSEPSSIGSDGTASQARSQYIAIATGITIFKPRWDRARWRARTLSSRPVWVPFEPLPLP